MKQAIVTGTDLDVEEIGGSFKQKEAKITDKNTPYIFSLLSKIYSKPKASIVREITSNCFDAHIAVNKQNEVVFVRLYIDDSGQHFIEFVDKGTGISESMMDDIYMSYGESTKRESDDFIGCFGLGSKSPFSESNYFYVITKFGGKESTYLLNSSPMSKPTYDCLIEVAVDQEDTGTTVRVPIKPGETSLWERAISEQLRYFKNVYVVNFPSVVNDYKIRKFNSFQIREDFFLANVGAKLHLCLGDVYYPIQFEELNESTIYFNGALTFNIGELEVSPNREELSYSDKTTKALKAKLKEFKKEIREIVLEEKNFQCNHLIEFRKRSLELKDNGRIVVKNIIEGTEISIQLTHLNIPIDRKVKYKIYLYDSYYNLDHLKLTPEKFCNVLLTTGSGRSYAKLVKFNSQRQVPGIQFIEKTSKTYIIIPKTKYRLANNERAYLNEQTSASRVLHFDFSGFLKSIAKSFFKNNVLDYNSKTSGAKILQNFMTKFKTEIMSINFQYIEDLKIPENYGKVKRETTRKATDTVLYYQYDGTTWRRAETMMTNLEAAYTKTVYVYGNYDESDMANMRSLFYYFDSSIKFIHLATKYQKDLVDFDNCFSIKEIITQKSKSLFFQQPKVLEQIKKSYLDAEKEKEREKFDFPCSLSNLYYATTVPAPDQIYLKDFLTVVNFFIKKKPVFNASYDDNTDLIKNFLDQSFIDKLQAEIKSRKNNDASLFQLFYNFCMDFYLEFNQIGKYNWNDGITEAEVKSILDQSIKFKKNKLNKYIQTIAN